MIGCFMRGGRLLRFVGFVQRKGRRIIPVLQDVKTQIAFFLTRLPVIFQRRLDKPSTSPV